MTKLNKLKLITLSAFMTLSAVKADQAKTQDFTHEFMAGLESYKYHYGESRPNQPNFMQYNGMMFGIGGSYELSYKDCVFIRPEARIAYGFTTYSNYESATYKIPKDSIPNLTFEPRLLMGGNISFFNNFKLSPYVGLGYRYKSDKGGQVIDDTNQRLYDRLSQYLYVPMGSGFYYKINDLWFIKGLAEYDWFISGRQFSYDSKKFAPSPIVDKQKNGWGAKAELLVGHKFDKVSIACGPYIHYWSVKKSSVETYTYFDNQGRDYPNTKGQEPDNITKEIGFKLNFYF